MSELDFCNERGTFVRDEETGEDVPMLIKLCGPSGASWHLPLDEQRAVSASCVAPPHAAGKVSLEYSPSGQASTATRSAGRRMKFEYYETLIEEMLPKGSPLTGGTALTISGQNLWSFGVAEITNVNGSARYYDTPPVSVKVLPEPVWP